MGACAEMVNNLPLCTLYTTGGMRTASTKRRYPRISGNVPLILPHQGGLACNMCLDSHATRPAKLAELTGGDCGN